MFSGQLLAMALATLVGLCLGALGSGGSIITTPVLVYVAHVPPGAAVGMSLFIVGVTSLVGAFLHVRRGNVAIKPAALFALTGMAGSFLGSRGTQLVSNRSLMLLFSGIMLVAALAMWRGPLALRPGSRSIYQILAAGFSVGLLTGFLGVGGGFLIVPALVLFAGLDSRKAAGTSLAVISLNCATGLLGQLRFIQLDWRLISGFLLFAIAGMAAGSALSGRLSESRLRQAYAVTVFVVGVAIGLKNLLP